MSAQDILQAAQNRAARRDQYEREHRIDYERMRVLFPKQKAALTRALNQTDPDKRRDAVVLACKKTVAEWNEIGAWPDEWSRWQRALDGLFGPMEARVDLRDL